MASLVFPEHKYEIVKCLQGLGHLCTMTGDSANDAPPCPVPMSASLLRVPPTQLVVLPDIVLTEPGLSTIIHAICGSRIIFQHMRNYSVYPAPSQSISLSASPPLLINQPPLPLPTGSLTSALRRIYLKVRPSQDSSHLTPPSISHQLLTPIATAGFPRPRYCLRGHASLDLRPPSQPNRATLDPASRPTATPTHQHGQANVLGRAYLPPGRIRSLPSGLSTSPPVVWLFVS